MSLFGNVKLFGKGAVGSINTTVTDIRRSVDSGATVRLVFVAKPTTVMVITVSAELGTARGAKPRFCTGIEMYAVVTLIMQDWLIIHVPDDFLGNSGRIFTKRTCDFIETFVFV